MIKSLDDSMWTKLPEGQDRAKLYPYIAPDCNFLVKNGKIKNLEKNFYFLDKIAVLAIGSNRSPSQLLHKFGNSQTIPVTKIILKNCDVVYASLVSYYGAVPATLWPIMGTKINLSITWLNDKQLKIMHETEAVGKAYNFVEFNQDFIQIDGIYNKKVPIYGYVATSGALDFGSSQPLALSFFNTKDRKLKAISQNQAIRFIANFFLKKTFGNNFQEFRKEIIINNQFRWNIFKKLEKIALKPKNPPWKTIEIKDVKFNNNL